MRPASADHPPAVRPGTALAGMEQAYRELIAAHEHTCALGQPLLTDAGLAYLRQRLLPGGRPRPAPAILGADPGTAARGPSLPLWDEGSRRLWLGGTLLKEFRQPAPNQTKLLVVFQEQGWAAAHIDDPLPLADDERDADAKRRLHETIKDLNRGLPPGTIRFRGDGTGQGVLWVYARPGRVRFRAPALMPRP